MNRLSISLERNSRTKLAGDAVNRDLQIPVCLDEVGQHLAQTLGFAPILTDRQFASFGLDGESAAGGVRRLQGPLCAAKNHRQPLLRVSRADAQTLSDLLDGAAFEVTHPEKL